MLGTGILGQWLNKVTTVTDIPSKDGEDELGKMASVAHHFHRGLALMWSALTVAYLLVLSGLIVADQNFPLKIGVISTTGRIGLWITLLPALVGLVAVMLAHRRHAWGTWLLTLYSILWAGMLLAGLPAVWNAKTSFCTRTLCITTPWIARSMLLGLAVPFILVAFWSYRNRERSLVNAAHT